MSYLLNNEHNEYFIELLNYKNIPKHLVLYDIKINFATLPPNEKFSIYEKKEKIILLIKSVCNMEFFDIFLYCRRKLTNSKYKLQKE